MKKDTSAFFLSSRLPPLSSFSSKKVGLLGLIASAYFIVAGGPYGLEDMVQSAGYGWAMAALVVVPLVWSLPTALMVSELASAMPVDGGYYVWVRRALGPFWGFQEAWLSLAASIFDMAIYPILFVKYLGFVGSLVSGGELWEQLAGPHTGVAGFAIGTAMIVVCVAINLSPAGRVGGSSVLLAFAMLAPFAVLSVAALVQPGGGGGGGAGKAPEYVTALLFALWNYMGWDNATTFAADVDRPQRTIPLAMGGAIALVMATYLIPVTAAAHMGMDPAEWKTGAWVSVGEKVGGLLLALAIGVGGMISALGMFSSLVLSYSRLPVVLAEDGYLPAVFGRRLQSGAPWVSVVVCAAAWALASQLGLKRVLALDVILYGFSLILEFAALVGLRLREPGMERPFRLPGGTWAAALLGVLPALLIALAIYDQAGKWELEDAEDLLAPGWALVLGVGLAALGPAGYFVARRVWGSGK